MSDKKNKATVTVRRLISPHQSESFTRFLPLNEGLKEEIFSAVKEIFDAAGGKSLLKKSGDVYLKPNAVDSKPYCFTRPELIEAVIRYWKEQGANDIYLFENCTQGNFTRMVYYLAGYGKICRKYGVKEIYLDEEKNISFEFRGKDAEVNEDGEGYRGMTFDMPEFIVERLIERKDENLYINLPKLKTHSMAEVTLGVKNQWGFPQQSDRRADHNYNLAHKLADVLGYIRPDFTLIEGVEAVVYGHYPVTAFADECIKPLRVLIGSKNIVAGDIVAARILGLDAGEVPHLKIVIDRGYSDGVRSIDDIEIIGDISEFTERYPTDLLQRFPGDVSVIKGKDRLCKEGCKNNPLTLLQTIYYDYGGKGGWTLIMGKGFDLSEINAIEGKVLIAGRCAGKEVGDILVNKLGKKSVYFSGHCNDLRATMEAMCHLMKVSPLKLAPAPFFTSLSLLGKANKNGSRANIPFVFANIIKPKRRE